MREINHGWRETAFAQGKLKIDGGGASIGETRRRIMPGLVYYNCYETRRLTLQFLTSRSRNFYMVRDVCDLKLVHHCGPFNVLIHERHIAWSPTLVISIPSTLPF